MISLVPPVIALTLLLSFAIVADRDRADTSVSGELARDLLRHHELHFRIAHEAGFPVGPVGAALPYPMEPLADWRSEVVQDGERRLLLTWAGGYGSDGLNPSAYRAVVDLLPARIGATGLSGVISFPGGGGARISDVEIPAPQGPLPAGTPAILRGAEG
jgi:hypothetical protein